MEREPGEGSGVKAVYETAIRSLPLVGRGKGRDIYAVGADKLLIVTTDRLSAADVLLSPPGTETGGGLSELASFRCARLAPIILNHLTGIDPESVVAPGERDEVRGRSVVVKRMQPLPSEAVVRGYLEGSGWKEYLESGRVCGIALPPGLKRASKLPQPIFTPATKAEAGHHDENITYERMAAVIGAERARQVRDTAIALYRAAADYALSRGIIIADTKFAFGVDAAGRLHLIDERALTPDSSRFWPLDTWREGAAPGFDKQYVRNWLDSIGFTRKPPAPPMPEPREVAPPLKNTRKALKRLAA
jgi:phosphoribosylaminoimidazole-succinocarboxamide synthase